MDKNYIHICIYSRTSKSQANTWLELLFILPSVHGTRRYSAHYQRRKIVNNSATVLLSTWWTTCLICWWNSGTNVVRITNHYLNRYKAYSMKQSPCLTLLRWSKTQDYRSHGPRENQILLFWWRYIPIKWLIMTLCHTLRSMSCRWEMLSPVEDRWEIMPRPTTK